ncbi:hypothetical protein ACFWNN_01230 [Lentzea sp. NPDC058450]|uniref:hypothetical protein n=1 Tax=Lentzea sp. NPDC058450 TaxID=3346505 RepID=UPI00364AC17F
MHLHAALDGLSLNPALPVGALLARADGSGGAAARPDLTTELIEEIIATGRRRLLYPLAGNPEVPGEVLLRLAHDPRHPLRPVLASRVGGIAPRELFELLLADPDPVVRENLAENDATPCALGSRPTRVPRSRRGWAASG